MFQVLYTLEGHMDTSGTGQTSGGCHQSDSTSACSRTLTQCYKTKTGPIHVLTTHRHIHMYPHTEKAKGYMSKVKATRGRLSDVFCGILLN